MRITKAMISKHCRSFLVLFLLFSLMAPLDAQEVSAPAARFSGAAAHEYIYALCQPEFAGRMTGHPGARKAAEWIAARFSAWGLQPAGDGGGYLQFFPMLATEQSSRASLVLKNGSFGAVHYQEGNDFTVYINSGSARVTAEVVFAGYGISEPGKGWDDFAAIDVRGKIMLVYRGLPSAGKDWEFANERDYKMRVAAAKGARALLMLDHGDWPIRGGTIHDAGYQPHIAACNISKKMARDLFTGSGRDLDLTLRDQAKKPQSFALGKEMQVKVAVRRLEKGLGENVVALLPGSDQDLRHEYLVIGGHMDHNGVGRDGHLYAGADDNASGTAVVMELARLFAGAPVRPKRSLLFIAFGGEEQGLYGSKYFSRRPAVPLENIVAMLNFDMEGHGNGGARWGGRNYLPEVLERLVSGYSDSIKANTRTGRGWGMGGSDHAHFVEQGIPAFGFSSSGDHPFYHEFEDLPGTINVASLQSVGDRAAEMINEMANDPNPLGVPPGLFFLRHGDQWQWPKSHGVTSYTALSRDADILPLQQHAIRVVAVPLNAGGATPLALLQRLDSLSARIREASAVCLRFENGGSLDRAAADGKIAIAPLLLGSSAVAETPFLARQLVQLGVHFIEINAVDDPVFNGEGISAFGRSLLHSLQETAAVLIVSIPDSTRWGALRRAFSGRMIWSLDLAAAPYYTAPLAEWLERDKSLAVIRVAPADDPDELSTALERLPRSRVHLDFSSAWEVTGRDLQVKRSLLQQFYVLRCQRSGLETAYKEMEQWFGRNMKTLLAP